MSRYWQSPRKKSLRHSFRCRSCCHRQYPWGNKDLVVLFIFLVGIAFLVVVFHFHVYFFVPIHLLTGLFPLPPTPPPYTKTAAIESQKIPYPSPSLRLHYWRMPVVYLHIALFATLSAYYGVRTSLTRVVPAPDGTTLVREVLTPNQLSLVIETPEQENRVWLLFQ